MSKGQLVILDIDLLLSSSLRPLEDKISEEGRRLDLKTRDLFLGQEEEDSFWQRIATEAGVDQYTQNTWREWWSEELLPREEIKHLEGWRKQTNLGLSANFFAPWLRRSLKKADVLRHIKYTWISSETGQWKPDPDAFSAAYALGLDTLYIDRDEANLDLAKMYDFHISDGKNWVEEVNRFLL